MKKHQIGDLVKITNGNNDFYGEIGIVTELPNDGIFAIVFVLQQGEGYWLSSKELEKIA